MVNTQLLEKKIEESGYRMDYIHEQLGITRRSYQNKINGETSFRAAEIYVLCDLLKISDEEKKKIFCAEQ